jgi:hypothetical protein
MPPPPPAYEPVFQTAPEPPRRVTPPPPPPYEPVFQASAEPKRTPVPPSQEPASQEAPEPQWPPTHEPVFQSGAAEPKRAPAAAQRPSQNDESNLAEMAQRLEAALRRPTKPVEPPPPPPAPPAPPPAAARPITPASRAAAYFDPPNQKGPAKVPESPAPAGSDLRIPAGQGKSEPPFESLEDEMAKMLGRTPGKT